MVVCSFFVTKYELPVTEEFIKDIPITKAGKKDYRKLEEMVAEGLFS